jgi:glutaredoxin
MSAVTVYTAAGCSLCERALEVVRGVRDELGFELEVVDIGGVAELEARYREQVPVVEIDGERAFTFFVDADALRGRLAETVPATVMEKPLAES